MYTAGSERSNIIRLEPGYSSGINKQLDIDIESFISGDSRDLILDFSGVETIESLLLASLIKIKRKLDEQGRTLLLENINERIHNVIEISGLASLFLE